jgi:hypothetical protein
MAVSHATDAPKSWPTTVHADPQPEWGEQRIENCLLTGAGGGNRTRMTSLEGWWHILDGRSGLRL